LSAAATQQQANAYNPFATALSGLAQNQQFGQGVANWWENRPQTINYNPSQAGDWNSLYSTPESAYGGSWGQ